MNQEISKKEFSHLDQNGKVKMVDVSEKKITQRTARAAGEIKMKAETLKMTPLYKKIR